MNERDTLRRLVDELPDSDLRTATRFLEFLRIVERDPVLQALLEAPEDDEPTTDEEDEGAEEAKQEYVAGKARAWEEVREELTRE